METKNMARKRLVGIFRFSQKKPGKKGTQGQRKSRFRRQPGGPQYKGQQGETEKLPGAGAQDAADEAGQDESGEEEQASHED
jgi:hypothetical protein